MSVLLSLTEAAPLVGCRDARTARKRLGALGVPVHTFDGRVLVDEAELTRALRVHARPLRPDLPPREGVSVVLRPGRRLWDGDAT